MAPAARVAEVAAGTGIHGGNEFETSWEIHLLRRSRNGDFSGFERLPQGFQNRFFEFQLGISNIAEIFQYYFLASVYQRLA